MFVSFEPFYIGDLSSLIRAKPWWVAIVLVVIVMLVLEMRKRWDECGIPKNLDGKHVWVVGGSRGIGIFFSGVNCQSCMIRSCVSQWHVKLMIPSPITILPTRYRTRRCTAGSRIRSYCDSYFTES